MKNKRNVWWFRLAKVIFIIFILLNIFIAGLVLSEDFSFINMIYWLLWLAGIYYIIPVIFLYIFFGESAVETIEKMKNLFSGKE